ncbi:hypothetical protein MNBD_GAMMA10-1723 [hydrothermal vent metagenome]|uniref:Uncharacterized protein n=1 Tax=hydrothermal vent metagenome TaxID=652676 RepID=A0A3B0YJQ8_9ZZZZ
MSKAAAMLPEHIAKSGETSIGELKTQGYQLFYLPHEIAEDSSWSKLTGQLNIPYKHSLNKKESKNTVNREMAARITASMQLIGKQNKEVCWTVQGSALEVFTPALEQLKGLGYRKDSENKNLGQQKVFFSNPIGSRIQAKKLVEELGLSPAHAGLESQMSHDLPGTIANKLSSLGHNLSDGHYTELAGEAIKGFKNYKSLSLVAGGVWAYHNYSLTQFNQLITENASKAADYALNNPVAATALMVAGGVTAYASSAKARLMIKSLTPSGRHQLAQIVECAPGVGGSSAATKRKFDAVHGTGSNISERIRILLASRNGLV